MAESRLYPLIAIDTMIDTDTGLFKLIKEEYMDPNIFDQEVMNLDMIAIVSRLYFRSVTNPLRLLCKSTVSGNDIDDYYNQFIDERYQDILNNSLATDFTDAVEYFTNSPEIHPTLMYYREEEKKQILTFPEFHKLPKISYEEALENTDKYSQFYFKYIAQAAEFIKENSKSFYFSDTGVNVTENGEPNEQGFGPEKDIITLLIAENNNINFFNIYNNSIINRKINNKGE